jgi:hypothetical protein
LTGAIVPPATSFFDEMERHLIRTEAPFDIEQGLDRLKQQVGDDPSSPRRG